MPINVRFCASFAWALLLAAPAAAEEGKHYLMATGAPGTKPYVVGVTLQSLINLKLMPTAEIGMNTTTTGDYVENLRAMGGGQSQFAIVDSVTADDAASGKGPFETDGGDRSISAVAVLWQEVDHFLVASDQALSGTITDIRALTSDRIGTDPASREAARALLTAFGMATDGDGALPVFDGPGQLNAMNDGTVAALAISRPRSSNDVPEIVDTLGPDAQLLEFTGRQLTGLGQGWRPHPISSDTYGSLDHDIDTVARSIMMVVDSEIDDEAVYQITRTMFENLPFLASIDDAAGLITLNDALNGMTLTLHPGAARFYQEVGLLPPGSIDPADVQSDLESEPDETAAAPSAAPSSEIAETGGDGSSQQPDASPQSPEPSPGGDVLPSFVLDDTMLNRSRAEIHDGREILKIDRPDNLSLPGTEIANVYFALGDTQPTAEGIVRAKSVGERVLQLYRSSKDVPEIYVEGHADRAGDWKVNYEIAHRRALATRDLMVAAGVPGDWIHISDHSEQKLAVSTPDGVSDWRNRRVEVIIIPRANDGRQNEAVAQ